jgi:sec-independent protein translocase protein TatC
MTLLHELKVFVGTIFYWIVSFTILFFAFFLFGVKKVTLWGVEFLFLLPARDSISAQLLEQIQIDLLPSGVSLLATNPISAFIAQILFAMLLSFLVSMPLFLYKMFIYLRPALFNHERRAVLLSVIPLALLFFSGILYSYFFLIPVTFEVLYPYSTQIGAVTYFSIDEFVRYVFGIAVVVGLMFLLPVFMVIASSIGVVPPLFWKNKWKHALLIFLISSAVITPDGTGITMIMLSVPLMALYVLGTAIASRFARGV